MDRVSVPPTGHGAPPAEAAAFVQTHAECGLPFQLLVPCPSHTWGLSHGTAGFLLDVLASPFDSFLRLLGEKSDRSFAEPSCKCLSQIQTLRAAVGAGRDGQDLMAVTAIIFCDQ